MNLRLTSPPALEPVSISQLKTWLRAGPESEDDVVAGLITAARLMIEATCRRVLVTQTWRQGFEQRDWKRQSGQGLRPDAVRLRLGISPVQSIVAVRLINGDGTAKSLSATAFKLIDADGEPDLLLTAIAHDAITGAVAIEVELVAGFGAPADVPEPLRQAIRMLATRWYEHRGDSSAADTQDLPAPVASLIAPWRRVQL